MAISRIIALLLLSFLVVAALRVMGCFQTMDSSFYHWGIEASYSKSWLWSWFGVTLLGEGRVVYLTIGLLFIFYFRLAGSTRASMVFLFLVVLFLISPIAKVFFAIARPVSYFPFYQEPTSFSFPSGHTVNGVLLFYFVPRFFNFLKNSKQVVLWRPLLYQGVMIFLVGYSRIFLGVHWFSDVLAGWILGFLVSITALWGIKQIGKHEV